MSIRLANEALKRPRLCRESKRQIDTRKNDDKIEARKKHDKLLYDFQQIMAEQGSYNWRTSYVFCGKKYCLTPLRS